MFHYDWERQAPSFIYPYIKWLSFGINKDIISIQTIGLILHAHLKNSIWYIKNKKQKTKQNMLVLCREVRNFCFLQLSYPFRKFWVLIGSFLNTGTRKYCTTENNSQYGCRPYKAVWRFNSDWNPRSEGYPPRHMINRGYFVKHLSKIIIRCPDVDLT